MHSQYKHSPLGSKHRNVQFGHFCSFFILGLLFSIFSNLFLRVSASCSALRHKKEFKQAGRRVHTHKTNPNIRSLSSPFVIQPPKRAPVQQQLLKWSLTKKHFAESRTWIRECWKAQRKAQRSRCVSWERGEHKHANLLGISCCCFVLSPPITLFDTHRRRISSLDFSFSSVRRQWKNLLAEAQATLRAHGPIR